MQIVIDVPNWLYNAMLEHKEPIYSQSLGDAVRDGTPLLKGHGRLIDTSQEVEVQLYDDEHEEFTEQMMTVEEYLNRYTNGTITIIEADKEAT